MKNQHLFTVWGQTFREKVSDVNNDQLGSDGKIGTTNVAGRELHAK